MSGAAAVRFFDSQPDNDDFLEDVLRGLSSEPKSIPPKYFYDRRGSELFDEICTLPEYYPTRTEVALLENYAHEIATLTGPGSVLVEIGSGASKKVRLLLQALRPAAYVGVDISKDFLLASTRRLASDYPWLTVHAVCADFSQGFELPRSQSDGRKLAFFPGSSIGNFKPEDAEAFLKLLGKHLGPDSALLIGVDLKKDPTILHAAYNDAAGVTAAFNLNLLTRIKRELGSDLDVNAFGHRALYNLDAGRVEMHLVSLLEQRIQIAGQQFPFADGETIHTENSYKYTVEEFQALASRAGYRCEQIWTDEQEQFGIHYLRFT